ncbi:MAG: hypothetical protein WKG07_24280 [Hymenobacter sp.]
MRGDGHHAADVLPHLGRGGVSAAGGERGGGVVRGLHRAAGLQNQPADRPDSRASSS